MVQGRTEVERRQQYIDLMELGFSCSNHPHLVELIKRCLHNVPGERPNTDVLLSRLQRMKVEVEGDYGGPFRLDMVRVRLAKEVKVKDRTIEELTRQQERFDAQMDRMSREMEELQAVIRGKDEEIANTQQELTNKDHLIVSKDGDLVTQDEQIATIQRELITNVEKLEVKNAQIQQQQHEIEKVPQTPANQLDDPAHVSGVKAKENKIDGLLGQLHAKNEELVAKEREIRNLLRSGQTRRECQQLPLQRLNQESGASSATSSVMGRIFDFFATSKRVKHSSTTDPPPVPEFVQKKIENTLEKGGSQAILKHPMLTEVLREKDIAALTEFEKRSLAVALSDGDLLWEDFFSCVALDSAARGIEENMRERGLCFTHPTEIVAATQRSLRRFTDVCSFTLKLILIAPRRNSKVANAFASLLETRFGPLHAALQVGNVTLEWNEDSLVCPVLHPSDDRLMEFDVQHDSEWVRHHTAHHQLEMQIVAQELNYSEEVELLYKVTSEKVSLIDALIDLIVEYNKHYYYNLFDRNCQHFVLDALRVLEVTIPKELPGNLGEYYKALVRGKTPSVPSQFATHSDLDEYVIRQKRTKAIGGIKQHDLEFLLALYFRFHIESRAKLKDNRQALEAWHCPETTCCQREVERHINIESMKIHKFCC